MSVTRARLFRKNLTPFEARLWLALKTLRPQGLHFRRQVPRDGYVLDFACLRAWLIVELDGEQHAFEPRKSLDIARDRHFLQLGYLTLRFWNTDLKVNFEGVVDTIILAATERQARFDKQLKKAPPLPSPLGGEGDGEIGSS